MLRQTLTLAFLALNLNCFAQSTLDLGFSNPPDSAKPHTWWHWINGNISKAGITADLEAMKKIGLGGAQIFNVEVGIPEGDKPFMSEQWKEATAHAFKEAKRLGIEICVHNCAGWSSSGGPWVKPEFAMQELTWSETPVAGGTTFNGVLPQPGTRLGYYRDVAVYAIRKAKNDAWRIANIRQKASFERGDRLDMNTASVPKDAVIKDVRIVTMSNDGKVTWKAPEGDWVLIRMGHTPTGAVNAPSPIAGRGPEVDKLSRAAMDAFWGGMMATDLKLNGKIEKAGLMNALIDSYEVGSQNWTPEFQNEFKKRRGYDPMPFLPVVTGRVVGSPEKSEKFLWDFRRTICDLSADNYFGYFKALCHKAGIKFSTEGYGNGSFDNLQVSGMADIPMGEFWVGGSAMETTKLAASAAHTNGRTVVGAESFTADDNRGRWLVDPYSIKALGDKVFAQGINRYIFHRYTHQPWDNVEPGMTMGPWGMNLERTITWWNQGSEWMKSIARCQFMLQQGRFVGDLAVFTGDSGPNDLFFSGAPKGYDYDGLDSTVLSQLVIKDGKLVTPGGNEYRVLVLPDSPWMTLKTLRKIESLVREGATVAGPAPSQSPSLSDVDLGDLPQRIWGRTAHAPKGTNAYGKGHVYWGTPLADVLLATRVEPDLKVDGKINWIHRKVGNTEIYFVANPNYRNVRTDVSFRVTGLVPEIWNPDTGTSTLAPVWNQEGSRTSVTVTFDPAGSAFVVFRKKAQGSHFVKIESQPGPSDLPTPKIEIVQARYEAIDGVGGVDVTRKVKELLSMGETEVAATNENFGDSAVNHRKRLRVTYLLNGVKMDKSVDENDAWTLGTPVMDTQLPDYELKDGVLYAWKPGGYTIIGSQGARKKIRVPAPMENEIKGRWDMTFQAKRGAPSTAQLEQLASWSESPDPGIKYFSGTATYNKTFDLPDAPAKRTAVFLDLGKVKNFAEVTVNGHSYPTLWKAPFRLDVTDALVKGSNKLVVKVTNLWPNRLIGDEVASPQPSWMSGPITSIPSWLTKGTANPESKRVAFATWKFFTKDSALLESGLIGPVVLRTINPLRLVSN